MPFVGQPYHKNDSPSSSHADFKCVSKGKSRIQFQLVLSRTWDSGVQLVITKYAELIVVIYLPLFLKKIGIHSMQGQTVATKHGVKKNKHKKK